MRVSIVKLRRFIADFTGLTDRCAKNERAMRTEGAILLRELVTEDDWLPDFCAAPDPKRYQQHLLWCDPHERFSVVSFVWGPGQETPVHDHTVWGLIGMLRGAEIEQSYVTDTATGRLVPGDSAVLRPGEVAAASPSIGDIHQVRNALSDRPSFSIHVYGANIGGVNRHVFDLAGNTRKSFISGYSAAPMPNIWDRSVPLAA